MEFCSFEESIEKALLNIQKVKIKVSNSRHIAPLNPAASIDKTSNFTSENKWVVVPLVALLVSFIVLLCELSVNFFVHRTVM